MSREEMTHAFWQGIIAGIYVTPGETYKNNGDTVFWAEGGKLVGSSPGDRYVGYDHSPVANTFEITKTVDYRRYDSDHKK